MIADQEETKNVKTKRREKSWKLNGIKRVQDIKERNEEGKIKIRKINLFYAIERDRI